MYIAVCVQPIICRIITMVFIGDRETQVLLGTLEKKAEKVFLEIL